MKIGRGSWKDVICSADLFLSREHCIVEVIRGHFNYVNVMATGGACYHHGVTYEDGQVFNCRSGDFFELTNDASADAEKIRV